MDAYSKYVQESEVWNSAQKLLSAWPFEINSAVGIFQIYINTMYWSANTSFSNEVGMDWCKFFSWSEQYICRDRQWAWRLSQNPFKWFLDFEGWCHSNGWTSPNSQQFVDGVMLGWEAFKVQMTMWHTAHQQEIPSIQIDPAFTNLELISSRPKSTDNDATTELPLTPLPSTAVVAMKPKKGTKGKGKKKNKKASTKDFLIKGTPLLDQMRLPGTDLGKANANFNAQFLSVLAVTFIRLVAEEEVNIRVYDAANLHDYWEITVPAICPVNVRTYNKEAKGMLSICFGKAMIEYNKASDEQQKDLIHPRSVEWKIYMLDKIDPVSDSILIYV